MTKRVAHIVREAGILTEPFIRRRVEVGVAGWESEQWSESGAAPAGVETVPVDSRLIAPGSLLARAFHRAPQLGGPQREVYRTVAANRRPDLIHAHYLTTGYLAMKADRPLVVGAYGFDVGVLGRRSLWRRALTQLASGRPVVLVEGPHMREAVVELGFPEDRVRVVPIAVGHDRLSFQPSRAADRDAPKLVVAGRFVEKKGIDTAIRAFPAIRRRQPGATLEIIGGGRLEADLRSIAAGMRTGQAITFSGSLSRDAYLERVRTADLLLAPSRIASNGDTEGGAPTTILDAQAVGTIAVGSTHADIPFLIEDGRTGFLAAEGSVDSLVDAVTRAAAAIDRWPEIASAARAQVERRHDDASLASGLAKAYASALGDA